MSDERDEGRLDEVFLRLEPPPGGVADLRRRVGAAAETRYGMRWWPTIVASAAAALAGGIVLVASLEVRSPRALEYPESARPLLMSLGLVAPPPVTASSLAADGERQALLEIATDRPGLSIYWVQVMPEAHSSPGGEAGETGRRRGAAE